MAAEFNPMNEYSSCLEVAMLALRQPRGQTSEQAIETIHMTEKVTSSDASDFVEEVVTSLQKRSRAIKHRNARLKWTNVKEIEDGVESRIRRVDIDISYRTQTGNLVQGRFFVW